MKTHPEAFMDWFDRRPPVQRQHLAHLFMVITTEDAMQMTATPSQSLRTFHAWAVRSDFPLRIAARMFYIRSVFDMVILHYHELQPKQGLMPGTTDNIIQISGPQWKAVLDSWKRLRQKELTDTYIHSWTSWMIKRHMETS